MRLLWEEACPALQLSHPLNVEDGTFFPGATFRPTTFQGGPVRLLAVEKAEIIWWNYGTIVLDQDGREIPELGLAIGERPSIEEIRRQEPLRLPGVTASVMSWLPGNYCHILWESLPLIGAFADAGCLPTVDTVLCDAWADHLVRDALSVYGSTAAIAPASDRGHALVDHLLVFERIHHPAQWGHPAFGRFFDRLRSEADDIPRHRHLLIERAHSRVFANADALRAALPDFEVVSLEGRPGLLEQVRLFASARIVVAAHGAALSNLVFLRRGSGVVELFAQDFGSPCFWAIAAMRDTAYCACADARGAGPYQEAQKFESVEVDIEAVVSAVDLLRRSCIGS